MQDAQPGGGGYGEHFTHTTLRIMTFFPTIRGKAMKRAALLQKGQYSKLGAS